MTEYIKHLHEKIVKYKNKYKDNHKISAFKMILFNFGWLFKNKYKSSFKDNKIHLGIMLNGGIGDYVINAKYLYALKEAFGSEIAIDLLAHENFDVIKSVFFNKGFIDKIINTKKHKQYDAVLSVCRFPKLENIDNKRLSTFKNSGFAEYLNFIKKFEEENPLLYKSDFLGRHFSLIKNHKRENQADIDNRLNMKNIKDFLIECRFFENVLKEKHNLEKDQYITIQTGPGKHFSSAQDEVRQWPTENYEKLVRLLKSTYPNFKIVQLGHPTHKPIDGTDLNLLGQTNFEELKTIVKNSKLHISQEGGTVILRHFLSGKLSVVLFGPTDSGFMGFEENHNINAQTGCNCEWVTNDWYKKCLKNPEQQSCMKLLEVNTVLEKVKEALS